MAHLKCMGAQTGQDKFDLLGDPINVENAVATQCGRRLSNHNFILHKNTRNLEKQGGKSMLETTHQWTSLITKKWAVPI
ncbi:hypothetical protein RHGRI_005939 [Rhododendron griersonianum]|uniref:Uncharacterized protein n=1 Tax=Rhododendron griersonianum TaxID=479676 RepID=A0AAV6IXB0_9ERIC|nr:hypothetical protein RHGRI_026664 [Rhododendron griersonianum]KAG5563358.1 hypothetical protein RHGRI_005939 [Rhododendron griersonianum]